MAGLPVDANLGKSGQLGLVSFLMHMTIMLLRRPHVGNAIGGVVTAVTEFPGTRINQGRTLSLPKERDRGEDTALLLVRLAPGFFSFLGIIYI